ncbi:MAG TPA: hypothetical protein VKC60_13625 [Opitutaceae bacterium]|nr:hypothetical protein [Opitutaceae bacterium]
MNSIALMQTTDVTQLLILRKLESLQTELIDLAVTLECRGRLDAADVAIMTSSRIGELCTEFAVTREPLATVMPENVCPFDGFISSCCN